MTDSASPYLSVVAVSRNDDHGGDPLRRTQISVDSLAWQAEMFRLPVELVLVDWNPPSGKPPLWEALHFPINSFFTVRCVMVPPEFHRNIRHGDRLPLFQMIGKNVGIRRAAGEFILCTNIDILLSDDLFAALAQRKLDRARMYRADRYDVQNTLPDAGHEAQQAFCRDTRNQVRRNYRCFVPGFAAQMEKDPVMASHVRTKEYAAALDWADCDFDAVPSTICVKQDAPLWSFSTNACGDFTLMHRDAWAAIRGYAEFEAYSMNIDSLGCLMAHDAGFRETSFLPPCVCYHIEHAPMSGWTPEHGNALMAAIRRKGILIIEWEYIRNHLLPALRSGNLDRLNHDFWGLRDFLLPEVRFEAQGRRDCPASFPEVPAGYGPYPVAAILQSIDPYGMMLTELLEKCPDYLFSVEDYLYFKKLVNHPLWICVDIPLRILRRIFRGKRKQQAQQGSF